jgi:hypothetical protein
MKGILVVLILLGLLLTVEGAMIMLTNRGLERMYKSGIWSKRNTTFSDKQREWLDRYIRGGGFFLDGLIMLVGSLFAFLSQWESIRVAIAGFFTF